MRRYKISCVLALSILMFSDAFAADPKDIVFPRAYVCWGEGILGSGCDDFANPYPGKPPWRSFPCGTGGSSGFNQNVVCRVVCGPRLNCTVYPGLGDSFGACGFRWADVRCHY
jgi:hypothetical protein